MIGIERREIQRGEAGFVGIDYIKAGFYLSFLEDKSINAEFP
jgi:hypothetical protein